MAETAAGKPEVSMATVHTLTTYQLRQEVEGRGLLGDLTTINYNTLLQRLVQALVEEEREAEHKRLAELDRARGIGGDSGAEAAAQAAPAAAEAGTAAGAPPLPPAGETLQQRLAREREERKAAALARSRARTADPAYFASKAEANVPPPKPAAAEAAAGAAPFEGGDGGGGVADEDEDAAAVKARSAINPRGFKVFSR